MKKVTELWLKAWLYVMTGIAGAMVGMLIAGWNRWDIPMKLMMFLSIALAIHVMEEWRFPGGFYYMYNKLMGSEGEDLDRYPMDQVTDMLTNFVGELIFIAFLAHGITPRLTVLVLGFCVIEILGHMVLCTTMNMKWYHTLYNPGLITTLFGFLPLGIYTFVYLIKTQISLQDVGIGILYTVLVVFVCIILVYIIFKNNKESEYGYYKDYGYGIYKKYIKSEE